MKKKIIAITAVVMILAITVTGALAYLTDTDKVENKFKVGNIDIDCVEPIVNEMGEITDYQHDTHENTYRLIPGHEYIKCPKVHIFNGSESCYVRMLVTVTKWDGMKQILVNHPNEAANFKLEDIFNGYENPEGEDGYGEDFWVRHAINESADGKEVTYEYWYRLDADTSLDVPQPAIAEYDGYRELLPTLFGGFTVPTWFTNEDLALIEGFTMNVVAQAIQADGFTTAAEAWAAFDAQP